MSIGTTGRPPDPKAIRLLKNDKAHAYRYAGKEEPEPSETRPQAPEYLSVRATEIFEDFVMRIEEMYPASNTDLDIIVLYANNKEQLESYELTLRELGSVYETVGGIRARPEVSMLKECKALQLHILREFGLSPSARSRINIKTKAPKAENPFAAVGSKVG